MMYVIIIGAIAAVAPAAAESIPEWIKASAGWWADGSISDAEFMASIQYLISEGVIVVEPPEERTEGADSIPHWIKTNAGWWAEGLTSDAEFAGSLQYLISAGIIRVENAVPADPLEEELAACAEITRAYERLECEDAVEAKMTRMRYEAEAMPYRVGAVTYYYPGHELEKMSGGQHLLTVRMLAVNHGTEKVTLMCTGPAICNYDVIGGDKAYKYASTDFTSGSIAIKSGGAREFEMMFGPNIGYGGTQFVCDPSMQYSFRISEPFGSVLIPMDLDC